MRGGMSRVQFSLARKPELKLKLQPVLELGLGLGLKLRLKLKLMSCQSWGVTDPFLSAIISLCQRE